MPSNDGAGTATAMPLGTPDGTLLTPRLRIRPFTLDDADFIVELLNDPGWLRFIGDRQVRNEADARRYLLEGPIAMRARHGLSLCAVERRDAAVPIGMCGLIRRDGLDDVDLGYALLPVARGQGMAVEAAAAMLQHGLTDLGLPRIVAITDPANLASAAVLERIGMRFEREVVLPHRAEPLRLYTT
jgi:[ribosomal protein S5]-alanine N-acetyltransferase